MIDVLMMQRLTERSCAGGRAPVHEQSRSAFNEKTKNASTERPGGEGVIKRQGGSVGDVHVCV